MTVEEFTEVQLLRRSRAAGGMTARAKLERGMKAAKRPYPLRGRVRCSLCERRMQGTPRKARTSYRCAARTLVPGSAVLGTHPKNIYLPEVVVMEAVNEWLGQAFGPDHLNETVAALVASQSGPAVSGGQDAARRRLEAAQAKLRRYTAAIEAGVDPTALVESINAAQEERVAAQAELAHAPDRTVLDAAEVRELVDSLGDVTGVLRRGEPDELEGLYASLSLEMTYHHEERAVDLRVVPVGRVSARVRGRSCALSTRLVLVG